jgi:hypothetical protein
MLLHLTNFEGPWNSTNGADQTPRSIVCLRGALHAAPEYADAMFNLALPLQRAGARLRGSSGRFKASILRGARRYQSRMAGAPAQEEIDEPTGKFLRPRSDIAHLELLA